MPRLAVVNGLRGIAILWVMYHHLLKERLTPIFGAPGLVVQGYWLNYHVLGVNGWAGVNLFFVLSGLVLYLPHAAGQKHMTSLADVKSFYVRRARRLLPLYYLALLVFYLSPAPPDLGSMRFFGELAKLVTFAFSFSNDLFMPFLNVALWSLGVEVWFSVIFPLLALAVRRFGMPWVTVAALVVSLGTRIVAIQLWDGPPAYHLTWKDGLFARLDDFVVGMAVAQWLVRRRAAPGAFVSTLLVVLGFVLFTAGCTTWDNVVVGNLKFQVVAVVNDVLLAGMVLVLVGMHSRPPALFRFLLTNLPLQLAGAMCYSLYLWHLVGARIGSANEASWSGLGITTYLVFVFALSALSYRFVEFPERRARSLFLDFPRAAAEPAKSSTIPRKNAPLLDTLETVSEKGGPT